MFQRETFPFLLERRYNMEEKCIFKRTSKTCNALRVKDCENCSFYKSTKDYKKYYYLDNNGQKQVGVKER